MTSASDRAEPTVVVRGGGSIGARHLEVFRLIGADVRLWPVRPRPDDPSCLDDDAGPAAVASADLVVIATDTARHVADAVAALDLGASTVLLEKPVAPTLTDAAELARHARSSDVWVAAPLRAHEAFRHVLELLPSLDPPLSADVWSQSWLPDWRPNRDYRLSYSARADEGGVLRDLVHEIDYASVLFGTPELCGAVLTHTGPLDLLAEQAATLLWTTERASVTCRLDYITRPATRGLIVRSSAGCLEWDVPAARVTRTTADGEVTSRTFTNDLDRNLTMATQARAALDLAPQSEPAQRHRAGAPATLAEGLAALAVCDRARELSVATA